MRYRLKHFTAILFFTLLHVLGFAQDTGTRQKLQDSSPLKPNPNVVPHSDSLKNVVTYSDSLKKDSARRTAVKKTPAKRDSAGLALINADIIDSLKKDSLTQDSIKRAYVQPVVNQKPTDAKVKLMQGNRKTVANPDVIFYILVFILFFLGLIKTSFPRYFDSIFTLSFQATFRQTQTRDQMAQNFFPAFMINILFFLCAGLFITLFAKSNQWSELPFWELFVYATTVLLIIYLIKYMVISFTGWVFNAKEAAAEYRFVVFLINKLIGILMIPLLFLIAYADVKTRGVAVTIVICLVVFSLIIRYLVSLARIRKNLSITAFHFFIYLCAVEIMPLLVIYKVLFQQTSNR